MDEDDRVPQALDEAEQKQAEDAAALRPKVIHEVVREEGEIELRRSAAALGWSGFGAGGSMGFSFLALCLLRSALPDTPWRRLIEGFGYSVGFVIVILGRQQLYTESTLTAVLPVLTSRTARALLTTLRLWGIVLGANLVGTVLFATLILPASVFPADVHEAMLDVARHSVGRGFGPTLLGAIFAGWLIALMVWLLPNARAARLWIIILITYVVSIGQFSHIIAGSTEAFFAVFTGQASAQDWLLRFFLPTLIGNTIGGVTLVALLNHAPVAQELAEAGET